MDNVKKGILCQLFGGTNKTTSEERFRCDCGPSACWWPRRKVLTFLQSSTITWR